MVLSFPQVAMSVLFFTHAQNGTVHTYPRGVLRLDIIPRATNTTEIIVEQDLFVPGAWGVRVETDFTRRYGLGPIRFPAATTKEALESTLRSAWTVEQHRMHTMTKCFTRLREKESSDKASLSGSASPPPPRTCGPPRSFPRRE